MSITDILDLDSYPLDQPGSPAWTTLVDRCKADLATKGMFNLLGFIRTLALAEALAEVTPVLRGLAFHQERSHNIYFQKSLPDLPADHPARQEGKTSNRTVCYDQISGSVLAWIYDWPPFAVFLAAAMGKPCLFAMRDPLARINVMAYRPGEGLSWHFDRSEFTTTLLLQAPEQGGRLMFRKGLRSEANPNYDGAGRLMAGQDPDVKQIDLTAGTLNVFRGKNTAHCVTPTVGETERVIAVFSYYERPGVMFSSEEQRGFYGRSA